MEQIPLDLAKPGMALENCDLEIVRKGGFPRAPT
jgi:hypothetical protein